MCFTSTKHETHFEFCTLTPQHLCMQLLLSLSTGEKTKKSKKERKAQIHLLSLQNCTVHRYPNTDDAIRIHSYLVYYDAVSISNLLYCLVNYPFRLYFIKVKASMFSIHQRHHSIKFNVIKYLILSIERLNNWCGIC